MTNSQANKKLRVLWATDGSESARAAVPLLRRVVLPATERLVVLSVAPHSMISGARPDPAFLTRSSTQARQRALVEAEQLAEQEATNLDPPAVALEAISRWGNPIEVILKTARTLPADLIVLGAKGHSNLSLLLLGSVSQAVVQHSTRPVLIARPNAGDVRKVVIGYQGTTQARRAVRFLERLSLPLDIPFKLVYVIEPMTVPQGMPVGYREQALAEAHRINARHHELAERALNALAVQLRQSGRQIETEVRAGSAGPELDDVAHDDHADLIVVGSRRPEAERHFLLGTTAEQLVRHAHTSVLVVR